MKSLRTLTAALLVAMSFAGCATQTSREPVNLSTAKAEVKSYVDTGKYQADLEVATAPARAWIAKRAGQPAEKPAVVFDIDETTLSNLSHMTEADWGYQPESWSKWVLESKAPAIVPAREVYRTARANKVAVFFITGRRESERAATARNLKAQGMGDFEGLFVRSDASKTPVKDFKTATRRELTARGYTIIANLGDQQSDLDGGYAERTFKLPNPFYFIP